MKKIIFSVLFVLLVNSVFAFKYRFEQIECTTDGNFSQETLLRLIDIDTSKHYNTLEDIDYFLEQVEQSLLNTRLCNTVDFTYYENTLSVWETVTDENGDEHIVIPLYLIIDIEQTGNFIVVPYPKFDSNTGLEAKIKIRHNNFLGRMTVFDADTSYIYGIDKTHALSAASDFSIPFYIGKTNNAFYTELAADYNISHKILTTNNIAAFSFSYPFTWFSIDAAFEQHFRYEGSYFMKEGLIASVPIKFTFPNLSMKITPKGTFVYEWSTQNGFIPFWSVTPSLDIQLSQKDWILNFQKGYDLHFNANSKYNMLTKQLFPSIELTGCVYYPLVNNSMASNTAPSHRLHLWYTGNELTEKGSYIRGILDNEYSASSGIIINSDFTISLFQLYVDSLFQNEKLKKLNFELQMAPFIDFACMFSPVFSADFTTGLTILVHPLSYKSIQGRISFASNPLWLNDAKNFSSPYELYVGLGLFY